MSAKIRLFKKVNESQIVNEGEVAQQPAANQQQAQPAQNQQVNNQQTGQAQQPAANAQNGQQQNGQQQTVDQQLQAVLIKHFGVLQQNISKDLANIQGVKWVNVIQPKDQTFNSVMKALQSYVKQNIDAAIASVQQNQQQNNNNNNQQNNQQTQNTSINQ